jgi:hypothetical protein
MKTKEKKERKKERTERRKGQKEEKDRKKKRTKRRKGQKEEKNIKKKRTEKRKNKLRKEIYPMNYGSNLFYHLHTKGKFNHKRTGLFSKTLF